MKICLLINSLGPGGAERVVQTLANAWAREGHEVFVATLHNVQTAYELDHRVQITPLTRGNWVRGPLKLASLPLIARAWSQFLDYHQPTHALSLLPRSNLVNCLSPAFGNLRPIVVSERTTSSLEYSGAGATAWLMRTLIRSLYPKAREIIAISSGVKASLESLGIDGAKISVISNPQDLGRIRELAEKHVEFPQLQSKPRIINIGRLVRFKDRPTLLKAFKLVREYIDAQLVVMGDGPLAPDLRRMATDLGLSDHIWWAGWQENPFALMKQCDVYVHTSAYEGFGNVLTEAMACGLPVVATDCPGGIPEIFGDELRDALAPVGDYIGVAQRILALLRDKGEYQRACHKFQQRVERFSSSAIAAQYADKMKL